MFSDNLGFNPFDKNNNGNYFKKGAIGKKFLETFNQNHVFVYNGNPRKKISNMNHTQNLSEALNANIKNSSDVYFYVNGGRKLYAIKQFTCCFCDMDAGRDGQGKYFKPSIVMAKKKQFLKKINDFPVKPSWVVDTRNGYQCYWIFDNASRKVVGNNRTFWNGLQKKLVNYFGGDPRAIKANQIYRVPYTWWRKCWENKAPYFTSILSGSTGKPINVNDLQTALSGQSTNVVINPVKCSDEWYKGYAKAYNNADKLGTSVTSNVTKDILDQLNEQADLADRNYASSREKTYGCPSPVWPTHNPTSDGWASGDKDLSLGAGNTQLLKSVVDFLNQVSTPLYFSGNKFLSSAAKDLANKISDQFCIG